MHLSPQIEAKKQQTLSIILKSTYFYVIIHLLPQSSAMPCPSLSWGKTEPMEFEIAKVVKTNFTYGTIFSNINFRITLQKK